MLVISTNDKLSYRYLTVTFTKVKASLLKISINSDRDVSVLKTSNIISRDVKLLLLDTSNVF